MNRIITQLKRRKTVLFVVITMAFLPILILEMLYDEEKELVFWIVILTASGLVGAGFFLCWHYSKPKLRKKGKIYKDEYEHYQLPIEEKQHVLDNIFGILAGLAITTALTTYYPNYLALIQLTLFPTLDDLGYFIPTLHLIDFFVIAIPLTHSGYLFLSSIANEREIKIDSRLNFSFRLIGVFIISILVIALLFFLAGSIAKSEEREVTENGVTVINRYIDVEIDASNLFVFWLTLIVIVMIAWSLVIRRLDPSLRETFTTTIEPLEGYQKYREREGLPRAESREMIRTRIKERIHEEWIWLDVLTLGYLITLSLSIFLLKLIDDKHDLLYFNLALLIILVLRAILNYYIGRNLYFPLRPEEPNSEQSSNK